MLADQEVRRKKQEAIDRNKAIELQERLQSSQMLDQ
jgi:hypothetical protein